MRLMGGCWGEVADVWHGHGHGRVHGDCNGDGGCDLVGVASWTDGAVVDDGRRVDEPLRQRNVSCGPFLFRVFGC